SQGGLVITFHLRRGVRWHDGKPFTADDVLFTYQKLRDPKVHTPYASDFEDVASVMALDARTVRVTYKKRFAPGLASWGMGIIPKHIYEPSARPSPQPSPEKGEGKAKQPSPFSGEGARRAGEGTY